MIQALQRSQAIIEFGLDGRILNANKNFLDTLGYTIEEIRGQHHSLFVEPAYRHSPEYRAFCKLARGEFEAGKFKRIAKGGRKYGSRPPTTRSWIRTASRSKSSNSPPTSPRRKPKPPPRFSRAPLSRAPRSR